MQRTRLIIVACSLLAAPFFGSASPAPGCADLNPPGTWTKVFRPGGDRYFHMSDALTYRIAATSVSEAQPDSTGQWDFIQQYNGTQICLSNAPGTPWYSSSDTNLSFEIELAALWVKTRSRGGPSTNPNPAYIEMEVSAHAGRFICLATYAGTPTLTNVPETPESLPYTLAGASLSSARFCLAYLPDDPGFPTNARPRVTIRGLPLGPPQVELFWNPLSNSLYQIQFRPDLSSGGWTDLASPIIGIGTSRSAVDAITPDAAQRFYRVLEFP